MEFRKQVRQSSPSSRSRLGLMALNGKAEMFSA